MPMRLVRFGMALIAAAGIGVLALYSPRGVTARDTFYTNRHCCDLSIPAALKVTIEQEIYGTRFPSQIGQDKWVLFRMFPGVTDGFFLDVGSGEGTIGSNSKALEARGWKGICVDPFPAHMEDRTCQMFKDVVWSVSGHTVKFHTQGELGGVADTLGVWKETASAAPAVELRTVTLAEILERAQAPSFIHFLSLDIEGAELEALRGLPFERYRFGAMAIEHNEEEPKRTDIMTFLAERGYRRIHTRLQDDFFAPLDGR
jgi:FkbM family methyltransferase